MTTYDETINTFITLGLSELEDEVICFKELGVKLMECKAPLAYELKIIDKRFIAENWDRVIKTYRWMILCSIISRKRKLLRWSASTGRIWWKNRFAK